MVEEDKYCIDILTQVAAATKALQSVALGLLEEHLGHCVVQAVAEGGDTATDKVREASDAIARLVRSLSGVAAPDGLGPEYLTLHVGRFLGVAAASPWVR
jgi:DNA-binding FrmR family transcriptional regulator